MILFCNFLDKNLCFTQILTKFLQICVEHPELSQVIWSLRSNNDRSCSFNLVKMWQNGLGFRTRPPRIPKKEREQQQHSKLKYTKEGNRMFQDRGKANNPPEEGNSESNASTPENRRKGYSNNLIKITHLFFTLAVTKHRRSHKVN